MPKKASNPKPETKAQKPRPKTGESRKTKQPMKIDRLPEQVREALLTLRNRYGKTWEQIEELSAAPFDKDWEKKPGAGFIDWTTVDPDALELFPGLKLPKSTLQRWYDVRVEQVRSQVLREGEAARAFAEKFAGRDLDDVNGAVINALRDEIFGAMQSVSTGNRGVFVAMLQDLTLAMSRIQRVEIQKRKVDAEVKKLDLANAKLAAEAGDPREIYLLAAEDLLKKLRTYAAVRAVLDPIKGEIVQEMTHGADAFEKSVKARSA